MDISAARSLVEPLHNWTNVFKNGPSKIGKGRPYHFKIFKGCLPQVLLGPFSNTLTQLKLPA